MIFCFSSIFNPSSTKWAKECGSGKCMQFTFIRRRTRGKDGSWARFQFSTTFSSSIQPHSPPDSPWILKLNLKNAMQKRAREKGETDLRADSTRLSTSMHAEIKTRDARKKSRGERKKKKMENEENVVRRKIAFFVVVFALDCTWIDGKSQTTCAGTMKLGERVGLLEERFPVQDKFFPSCSRAWAVWVRHALCRLYFLQTSRVLQTKNNVGKFRGWEILIKSFFPTGGRTGAAQSSLL